MSLISWFMNLRKPKMPPSIKDEPFIPVTDDDDFSVKRSGDFVMVAGSRGIIHHMYLDFVGWVRIYPIGDCLPINPRLGDMFYYGRAHGISRDFYYYLYTLKEDGWQTTPTEREELSELISKREEEMVQSKLPTPSRPYNNKGIEMHLVQNIDKFIKAKDPETNAIRWFLDENRELYRKTFICHDEFDHPEIFTAPDTDLFNPKDGDWYHTAEDSPTTPGGVMYKNGNWEPFLFFNINQTDAIVVKYNGEFILTAFPTEFYYRRPTGGYIKFVPANGADPFAPKEHDAILFFENGALSGEGMVYRVASTGCGFWKDTNFNDVKTSDTVAVSDSNVYVTPDGKQHIYLGGEWYTNTDRSFDYAKPSFGHLILAPNKPTWMFDGEKWAQVRYNKEIDEKTLRDLQRRSLEAADSMPEFARLLNEFFNKV